MRTKCVQELLEIAANPGMSQRPPVCDDEGFYEPKQCTVQGGLCRCVDKETGEPLATGGLSVGVVEADESDMDCSCAQNFHQVLKDGCLFKTDKADHMTDAGKTYQVRY